jgi:hypothetical protein
MTIPPEFTRFGIQFKRRKPNAAAFRAGSHNSDKLTHRINDLPVQKQFRSESETGQVFFISGALNRRKEFRILAFMMRTNLWISMAVLTGFVLPPADLWAGPGPSAVTAWEKYIAAVEARIDFNPQKTSPEIRQKLESGTVYTQKIRHGAGGGFELDGGLIHHWLGTIFIPEVTLNQVLNWVQDYDDHYRHFNDVERSSLLQRNGDTFDIYLRLVRTKVVTVRYDTRHTAVYRRHDATHASSRSIATQIVEVGEPGKDSGFLWRMNSYWRFSQEHGGVFVECESVSLSRSIPVGLGWLVGKYIDSVPRESLQETLISIRRGLQQAPTLSNRETRR